MPVNRIHRPPSILSTPKRLANAINFLYRSRSTDSGSEPSVICSRKAQRFTYNRDFRLSYPERHLRSMDSELYERQRATYRFWGSSKGDQRKTLEVQGIRTVPCALTREEAEGLPDYGHGYVVRPLHHSQGRGWVRTDDPSHFSPGREYIQPVVQKLREFRLIYTLGSCLLLYRKRIHSEVSATEPWNHHQGSTFLTVNPESPRNYLAGHEVLEDLARNQVIQHSDLVGVDVIQDTEGQAFVLEFNSCPSLSIETSLSKVAEHIVNHSRYNQ